MVPGRGCRGYVLLKVEEKGGQEGCGEEGVNSTGGRRVQLRRRAAPRGQVGLPLEVRVEEAPDHGTWIDGVSLGEGSQVDGALGEQGTEQSGAHQGDVEGAFGVAPAFTVFALGDIATVMIAGLDTPVAAAHSHQLRGPALRG